MATGNFTTGIRFKIKAVRFNEHKDFLSWTATDVSPTHTQTLVLMRVLDPFEILAVNRHIA